MAAVPQGAFAAKKIIKNEEKCKEFYNNTELNPTNYSSKFMNSIWGQYNRYSVHNLKKIMDDNMFTTSASKENKGFAVAQAVEKIVSRLTLLDLLDLRSLFLQRKSLIK